MAKSIHDNLINNGFIELDFMKAIEWILYEKRNKKLLDPDNFRYVFVFSLEHVPPGFLLDEKLLLSLTAHDLKGSQPVIPLGDYYIDAHPEGVKEIIVQSKKDIKRIIESKQQKVSIAVVENSANYGCKAYLDGFMSHLDQSQLREHYYLYLRRKEIYNGYTISGTCKGFETVRFFLQDGRKILDKTSILECDNNVPENECKQFYEQIRLKVK